MSVIQLHRCDAVSLSHLWPTYFKSVLVSRSKTDPYKLSVEIRACPSTKPFLVSLSTIRGKAIWSPSFLSYGNSAFSIESEENRISLVDRAWSWITDTDVLDVIQTIPRKRVSISSAATDRFVSINRNLLICFFPSLPLSHPDAINFIIRVIWDKERVRSRCIRHLAADIDNFLISARPTYASLPSLSA